jgi:hypothetical protein
MTSSPPDDRFIVIPNQEKATMEAYPWAISDERKEESIRCRTWQQAMRWADWLNQHAAKADRIRT